MHARGHATSPGSWLDTSPPPVVGRMEHATSVSVTSGGASISPSNERMACLAVSNRDTGKPIERDEREVGSVVAGSKNLNLYNSANLRDNLSWSSGKHTHRR